VKEHKIGNGVIYEGNALGVLKQMPDECVDCIITSPPYWGLRDYGEESNAVWGGNPECEHEWGEEFRMKMSGGEKSAKTGNHKKGVGHFDVKTRFCHKCGAWYGQLGLEPTVEMYIEHLLEITAELKRVLKKSGVLFWNQGDTYGGSGCGKNDYRNNNKRSISIPSLYANKPNPQLKYRPKSLIMHNYRLAMRMVDEQEWILRNVIIWCLMEDTKLFVRRKNKYLHIPIKEIREGDFVFTIDRENKFKWVRVKNKFNNGKKPVLKITTKSGKEVVCSEEHQFPVKSSYYYGKYLKLKLKKAKNLSKKDFLLINYKLPAVLPDGNEDDYNRGFVIGFFIAEGSYIKRKIGIYKDNIFSKTAQRRWGRLDKPKVVYDGVQFSCGKKDLERGYLRYLNLFDITIKNYKGEALSVYSRDNELLNLIRRYVRGEHCDKKHFSQKVWNTSIQFIKGVIDGFLAGDGYFDQESDRWRVRIKPNRQLKEDLELACRLVGYEFRYEGVRKTNYGTKVMSFIIRKKIKRNTFGFLYADQIEKIEKIGEKMVYDIEVEPIYTSYCGRGKSNKPTKEKRKAKWNNIYFLANGVWTHNSKPNHMPSSVKDRFTNSYEPVFMFVKNRKYWFDLDAVRVPHKTDAANKLSDKSKDPYNNSYPGGHFSPGERPKGHPMGKNPGDVWSIPTQPFHDAHFAVFPEKLVEPMIKVGCPAEVCKKCGKPRTRITKKIEIPIKDAMKNPAYLRARPNKNGRYYGKATKDYEKAKAEDPSEVKRRTLKSMRMKKETIGWTDCGCGAGWEPGVVLDPFMGSGTVAVVAEKLHRRWIGIEINPRYIEMAKKRLKEEVGNYLIGDRARRMGWW